MGILTNVILTAAPRLVLLFAWLFTDAIQGVFSGFLMPLLGLIFLPYATMMYVIAYDPVTGMSTAGWVLVVLVALVDLLVLGVTFIGTRNRE